MKVDLFAKVKRMIQDLFVKLMEETNEEVGVNDNNVYLEGAI